MATIQSKLHHQREAQARLRKVMEDNGTPDLASLFESLRTRVSDAIREQELNVLRHERFRRVRECDSAQQKLAQLVGDRDVLNALAHALRAYNPTWEELFGSFLLAMVEQVEETAHAAAAAQ